jgi:hypothetical protein
LNRRRPSRFDILVTRCNSQIEIGTVELHKRLPKLDRLSGVNETLDDLPSDAKAEIALNACGDDACERPLTRGGRFHCGDADKRRL